MAADRRDQAGDISQPADHARHHHGVFRADDGAAGRVWKLFPAHSNWRARHGVPGPEHAFVLDHVCGIRGDPLRVLRDGRGASARLDWISSAERAVIERTGGTTGRRSLDYKHRDFLHCVADGGAELYHHHARPAGKRHDDDAHAAHRVVVVYHCDSRAAGVRRAALGRHSVADGSQSGHQLLCAVGCRKRSGDGPQGRVASAVATSVLVLRAPRGLHCDFAGHGGGVAGSIDILAQTDFRLPRDGLRHVVDRIPWIHGVGPSHVHERDEPLFGVCIFNFDDVYWRTLGHQDI